jgi:hypothetical protein
MARLGPDSGRTKDGEIPRTSVRGANGAPHFVGNDNVMAEENESLGTIFGTGRVRGD